MRTILAVLFLAVFTVPVVGMSEQDPKDKSASESKAETPPQPIGGMIAIQKNVHYPEVPKKAGIQGTVYVDATIDEKGDVVSTRITKGAHPALDSAATKAVAMTKFNPAKRQGKSITTQVTVPIRFRLDAKERAQKHMLYTGNYEVSGGGIKVPENAEWKAMNTEIEKDKVLLVLQEKWGSQDGFWSVMSYLTKEEAKKLAEELRKAAENVK